MTIEQLRIEIDTIDQEIQTLLNKRAILAGYIGEEKNRLHLPIKDEQREKQVLQQLAARNTGPLSPQQIITIFEVIINECRNIQLTDERSNSWSL